MLEIGNLSINFPIKINIITKQKTHSPITILSRDQFINDAKLQASMKICYMSAYVFNNISINVIISSLEIKFQSKLIKQKCIKTNKTIT